jgi:hypothetical protein
MISRCSEARDSTKNRNELNSETTTGDTTAGYRRIPATSIGATGTKFSVGTADTPRRRERAARLHEAGLVDEALLTELLSKTRT